MSDTAGEDPPLRVLLESGRRRVFACALEWPGWCRSAMSEEAALDALAAYAGRYRAALVAGGLAGPSEVAVVSFDVIERLPGRNADFGAIGAEAEADRAPVSATEAQRLAGIVHASWSYLDSVLAGAPFSLRKGPRGGGRDRDAVAEHVVGAEIAYARHLGVRGLRASWSEPESVAVLRGEIAAAIRAGDGLLPLGEGRWPVRSAARRVAWHSLDHAWEIEDRSD